VEKSRDETAMRRRLVALCRRSSSYWRRSSGRRQYSHSIECPDSSYLLSSCLIVMYITAVEYSSYA